MFIGHRRVLTPIGAFMLDFKGNVLKLKLLISFNCPAWPIETVLTQNQLWKGKIIDTDRW